jgi:D-alanyl-D-alanine carboxypeptidase
MNLSKYLFKTLLTTSLIFGLILIVFSILLIPDIRNNFQKNFGVYEKISLSKGLVSTDNEQFVYEPFIQNVLSCSFPNPTLELPDDDELDLIINKQVKLKDNYVPSDLVKISDFGVATDGTIMLRQKAVLALADMNEDLKSQGIKIRINSGYRDFATQQDAYNYWVRAVGKVKGETLAAPVGGSEHHLGTTIDIVTSQNNYKLLPTYTSTKLYSYLINNAHLFGFTMSYPKGKESITGYSFEPWHYRYVGTPLATYLYENNLTLTEYMYELNNYCLLSY